MEYSEWYERISRPFRSAGTARAIGVVDRVLVAGFVIAYAVLLGALFLTGNNLLMRTIVVPAVTFALVTMARILINRPRPYEAHDIRPLIAKETVGKSMPSRHMASAVIIAFAYCQVWPIAGAVLFVGCAVIAFTRIVGGVHYPTDILAAIAVGLACGVIGFIVF